MQTQRHTLKRQLSYDTSAANDLFRKIILRFKVSKVLRHWKKLTKNSRDRYYRLDQWIKTQKAYIDDLKLIVQKIQKPLRQKKCITPQQERIIFPNIQSLIMLSEQMYTTLKKLHDNWDPIRTQIAPTVIKLSNYFKIYSEYLGNYLNGQQIMNTLKQNPVAKQIQKKLLMKFEDYLSKPTQRVVKYKLLLTAYKQRLRKNHFDYQSLSKAIQIYHEVVQRNNQALQNQIRMKRMIEIQKIYKNIIQSSRQYKDQFQAIYYDTKNDMKIVCRVYVFSDLLLVAVKGNSNAHKQNQQLINKIFIDGNCFVQANDDIPNQLKTLFVTGKQNNMYFYFTELADRNRIFHLISGMINSIHVNEWKRKTVISKAQSRRSTITRLSKPCFNEHQYYQFDLYTKIHNKFRISLIGYQQRQLLSYKQCYYIVKLQLPFPQVIHQKSYVSFSTLQQLQRILIASYPHLMSKGYVELPKSVVKSNQIKVIEYRMMRMQGLLNYVLRAPEFQRMVNIVLYYLTINQSLFQFITTEKSQCEACNICENGNIISNFQTYKQQEDARVALRKKTNEYNFCINRSFHVQNRMASYTKKQNRYTSQQILLYINCKLGIINSRLTNRVIQGSPIPIKIHIADLSQWQYPFFIPLQIYRKDTVSSTLNLLQQRLAIPIKDYGLFLVYQDTEYLLGDDQIINDLIKQFHIKFQEVQGKRHMIKSFFSNLIKSSDAQECFFVRIYLKKIYYFSYEMELLTSNNFAQRRKIICDQAFYRFKNRDLNLTHQNLIKFCAIYLILQNIEKQKYLKADQIKRVALQPLFAKSRQHILDPNFLLKVSMIYKIFQQKKISVREYFQQQMMQILSQTSNWTTYYCLAQNLKPAMFNGNQKIIFLGVNCNNLVVYKESKNISYLQITLQKLNIRFVGLNIFIYQKDHEYQFRCQTAYTFKQVLQKYLAYNKYFLGKGKVQSRPLMQETF